MMLLDCGPVPWRVHSLLCKWVLGFYWAILNTWAQVLPDESQLIPVYTEWNILLDKWQSRRVSMGLSFLFLVKGREIILVVCISSLLCHPPSFLCDNMKSQIGISETKFHMVLIWVLRSIGQLCSEPAAYLESWIAATSILKAFACISTWIH